MKRHNDQILKDVLKDMVDTYKLRSKLNQTKVKSLWSTLMGPSISRYTTDISVRRNKLYIQIESASLRQELSMGKDKIKTIINEELGEEYIEEVIIR
jgi:predicted nucleic acid-binding Zn ribbon protein